VVSTSPSARSADPADFSPSPDDLDTPEPSKETAAYVFPLQPSSVADYSEGHHDYPATDIFAPSGTEFVAVTSGMVDFISSDDVWDPAEDDPATRGGLSVAIVGDDNVRYYGSHLSSIRGGLESGDRVEVGQRLGRVGQSGNAASTAPHLHFGISHPTTPDDWETRRGEIDPFPYLQAWEHGRQKTPDI
jgi:peptidoglycan LD-endopeptidase LytH